MAAATATAAPPAAPTKRPRLFPTGGETLEDSIVRSWDELVASSQTECPVCRGQMTAAHGCTSCGSELS